MQFLGPQDTMHRCLLCEAFVGERGVDGPNMIVAASYTHAFEA